MNASDSPCASTEALDSSFTLPPEIADSFRRQAEASGVSREAVLNYSLRNMAELFSENDFDAELHIPEGRADLKASELFAPLSLSVSLPPQVAAVLRIYSAVSGESIEALVGAAVAQSARSTVESGFGFDAEAIAN